MKLYALSDLHINYPINRDAIKDLTPHPADWLILGGDCCDTRQDLEWLLDELGPKWQQLIWVPEIMSSGRVPTTPIRQEEKRDIRD